MERVGERKRVEVTVHGRVQGVGFRYFVLREAEALGLSGWVRNLRAGGVQIVAEGPEEHLKALLAAVRKGPPMAWVERVDAIWREPRGEPGGFTVQHSV
ncbi:MAG: acylphosphatase [Armatimonadota bacterium]